MSTTKKLPRPLSAFTVDVPANTYYDFELEPGSTYPLKGVTYPVDYGNLPGYTGEDGHELDFFIGNEDEGLLGYIIVNRGESIPDEHKFYVNLSVADLEKILAELNPVLIKQWAFSDMRELLKMVEQFKN